MKLSNFELVTELVKMRSEITDALYALDRNPNNFQVTVDGKPYLGTEWAANYGISAGLGAKLAAVNNDLRNLGVRIDM